MVVMCVISYAMPVMRGRPKGNCEKAQKVEYIGFWLMCISMCGITLALTAAGAWQVALQRLPESGDALSFMSSQDELVSFYWARLAFGVTFAAGLVAYFVSFFVGEHEPQSEQVNAS